MENAVASSSLLDLLEYLVDDRVGIVRELTEVQRQSGQPDFFHFLALSSDTGVLNRRPGEGAPGGLGASIKRDVALAKAVGETVERYCSAFYDVEELPYTCFQDAGIPCVRPDEFALYASAQYRSRGFPYAPFLETTKLHWAPATDLSTGQTRYVPAAMIYLPWFAGMEKTGRPIAPQISTGLACHTDPDVAAISAICEVVERDAITITWQARIAPQRIDLATVSGRNRELVRRFEQTGATVALFNVMMDHGIPCIIAVLSHQAEDAPARVFGSSAHPNPDEAVRKSLEELALVSRVAVETKSSRGFVSRAKHWNQILSQTDHLMMYCDHANSHLAEFMFASPVRISFSEIEDLSSGDPGKDLCMIVERVAGTGHRTLLADVTSDDMRQLGISVVRAVIPGFHPLFIGHKYRALGGTRLWQTPQKAGYTGIARDCGDNPAPHPFS